MIPFHSWSYLTTGVILTSMLYHKELLSSRPIRSLHLVIIFLGFTAIVTFTTSGFLAVSRSFLVLLLSYIIISIAIVKIIKHQWQLRALWLWLILLTANLSFNAYMSGKRIHGRLENIGTADSVSSNLFGLILAGVIPFLIPFLSSGKRYERILCLISIPFILNALVLCNSRGSLVALAGGFVAAYLFLADNQLRKKMTVIGVVLIGLFIYLADQELVDRMSSLLMAKEAFEDDLQANTLSSGRMEIWRYGLQMVGDHPFGAGPGGFKELAKEYLPAELLTVHSGKEYGVRGAHNSYLLVLVEQGPIGLMLWLFLCISTSLHLYKASVKLKANVDGDPFWCYAVFSMGISFATSLLGGLFTSRVYYEFFWWQIAMIIVLSSFIDIGVGENECPNSNQATGIV